MAEDLRADPNRRWAVALEIGAQIGTSGQGGKRALRQCLLTCPFALFRAAICDGS